MADQPTPDVCPACKRPWNRSHRACVLIAIEVAEERSLRSAAFWRNVRRRVRREPVWTTDTAPAIDALLRAAISESGGDPDAE